jgi:hypothetical protein
MLHVECQGCKVDTLGVIISHALSLKLANCWLSALDESTFLGGRKINIGAYIQEATRVPLFKSAEEATLFCVCINRIQYVLGM